MNEIVYPMTLSYVEDWNKWEAVRELVSNSFDADVNWRIGIEETAAQKEELLAEGSLTFESAAGRKLWIEDNGTGLALKHLLFGVSEKDNKEKARGQFGEGLKLAFLVLTRMGLTAHAYTGGLHLWNESHWLEDQEVFKIVWENGHETKGTRIEVHDWPYGTFEERFIRPGDPRIVHTDTFGRSLLEQDDPDIFVKGVWVQKAKGWGKPYAFGYDLIDAKMNRDRGVLDSWGVNQEIGKVWASVQDVDLLERFWRAVEDNSAERGAYIYGNEITSRDSFEHAFRRVYGKFAVAKTDDQVDDIAEHQGAKVVDVGYSLNDLIKGLAGTSGDYIQEMNGESHVHVPDAKLADTQKGVLRMLRRLAKRVGHKGKVDAYVLPEDMLGEAYNGNIRISIKQLIEGGETDAIETLIHELGHTKIQNGSTRKFEDAMLEAAAELVASYAVR